MGRKLWTPEGFVGLEEKGVINVTRRQIIMLSDLTEFAAQHQVNIFCKRCEMPITGGNYDGQKVAPSVSCQCREWRYVG